MADVPSVDPLARSTHPLHTRKQDQFGVVDSECTPSERLWLRSTSVTKQSINVVEFRNNVNPELHIFYPANTLIHSVWGQAL